jgi:translocation and assembly module TamA
VSPGDIAKVSNVQISYAGAIADDAAAEAQRDAIRTDWALRAGQPFTQQAWDNAKTTALRSLTAKRFPTGNIEISRAEVDADRHEARLSVTYQSGPAYKFGPLVLRGIQRYDADGARRIARLPSGPTTTSRSCSMRSSAWPAAATTTRCSSRSTPTAATRWPRPSSRSCARRRCRRWCWAPASPPTTARACRWTTSTTGAAAGLARRVAAVGRPRHQVAGHRVEGHSRRPAGAGSPAPSSRASSRAATWSTAAALRGGRSKSSDHIDRSYFLQYDYAQNRGTNAPPSASAVTANWGWTGRYFDDNAAPTRGYGLALEVAAGYTLTGEQTPFTRTYARWLGVLPLGSAEDKESRARRSRLQLRAEAGAVSAKDSAQIPSTLMFLTGGDTTVRGYSYKQIGTVRSRRPDRGRPLPRRA